MNTMPHELVWGEIYFPPLLLVIGLAYVLTTMVTSLATRCGLHKYVAFPALAELSLIVILPALLANLFRSFEESTL